MMDKFNNTPVVVICQNQIIDQTKTLANEIPKIDIDYFPMVKFFLVLVSILVCHFFKTADAKIQYALTGCDGVDFNYTEGSVYENNIDILLGKLTSKSSSLKFDNSTVGVGTNKVYGLFQCRNDVTLQICNECVKNSSLTIVEQCPLSGEATAWYFECMLRYSNDNIFSLSDSSYGAYDWSSYNVSNYEDFEPILANAMNSVITTASSKPARFASGVANVTLLTQLYTFAQCTPDIDDFGCRTCLREALAQMVQCCSASAVVMVYYPSCQLRYDTTNPILVDQSSLAPPPDDNQGSGTGKKSSMNPAIIGAIGGCVFVVLLVLAVVLWICMCRKKRDVRNDVPSPSNSWVPVAVISEEHSIGDTEFVQYDFATLELATRNFSDDNKLGEGGFGSVYKGVLGNGEQLAIKRLSGTGGQGTKEFMTEARFLAKLQHKNLVRLLGFCLEGDEKLLVYEFMPNGSLDGFLFDSRKRPLLDWVLRHKIIMGIARGLQYLHEDSRLTIIHRDLKPANILLDKEMNPKVADFGLAKLFGDAQKTGTTARIVGTQGYMAPEYLMTGDYSDKSDVYSFGIMLLEIVSGQRNRISNLTQPRDDISIQTWRLWIEGRAFDITDPILYNNCSSNDVLRCIQIGLLCLHGNASERPTMREVVLMLTGSVDLPQPLPPPMSSNQQSMPVNYSGVQQSGQYSTDSFTSLANVSNAQDLYPAPR